MRDKSGNPPSARLREALATERDRSSVSDNVALPFEDCRAHLISVMSLPAPETRARRLDSGEKREIASQTDPHPRYPRERSGVLNEGIKIKKRPTLSPWSTALQFRATAPTAVFAHWNCEESALLALGFTFQTRTFLPLALNFLIRRKITRSARNVSRCTEWRAHLRRISICNAEAIAARFHSPFPLNIAITLPKT